MRPKTGAWIVTGLVGLAALGAAHAAETNVDPSRKDPARFEIGVLTCNIGDGKNYIVWSETPLSCTFDPSGEGAAEIYSGTIRNFGLDLGETTSGTMKWGVLYTSENFGHGILEGGYGGVGAEAAVGVGGGANVLVGGSMEGITLQPITVQTQEGVNIAAGVKAMSLTYSGMNG